MNAKYWLDTHGRRGWYPITVPDPPSPTLRIPVVCGPYAEFWGEQSYVHPQPPRVTQIELKLVGIGHSEKTCGPHCTIIAVYM